MRAKPAVVLLASLLLSAACGGGGRSESLPAPAAAPAPAGRIAEPSPTTPVLSPPPEDSSAPDSESRPSSLPVPPAVPSAAEQGPRAGADPGEAAAGEALAGPPPVPGDPSPSPPPVHPTGLPFHSWKELHLVATGGLRSRGEVTLSRGPGRYRSPDRGQARDAFLVRTRATANALFFLDAEIESTSEVDPLDGSTREMVEIDPGKRAKLLRVSEKRLRLVRYEPPTGGETLPLRKWSKSGEGHWARPEIDGIKPPLYDFYALVGALDRFPVGTVGDHLDLWLATSSGPLPLRVEVVDRRRRSREIRDLSNGQVRTVRLGELRVRLRPLTDDPDRVRGFLSMQGETELWVEARSRMLLEVRGQVPHLGEVVVRLEGLR